jgi:hypothetical protein
MPRAVDGTTQQAIDTLQAKVAADAEIQSILRREQAQLAATRDQGGSARAYQNKIRDQITAIAKRKGYIPKEGQYFINPNDGQLEPHGGWSGLSNKTRAAIIAAAGAATWGATGFAGAGALVPSGGAPVVGGASSSAGTTSFGAPYVASNSLTALGYTAPKVGAGISSWLTPALAYGVPAATGLIATRMQANADRDATALQTDYLNRALDVEKENQQYTRGQRADYLARLKPYGDAGTAAVGRATDFLTTRYRPEAMAPSGLVALRDSRGVVKHVPAVEAERYLQMGAQRV